jgi:hypothetical protein
VKEPDVKVHLTRGCPLDNRKDRHTHPQSEWRAMLDKIELPWDRKKL